jgi:hypothetical protein
MCPVQQFAATPLAIGIDQERTQDTALNVCPLGFMTEKTAARRAATAGRAAYLRRAHSILRSGNVGLGSGHPLIWTDYRLDFPVPQIMEVNYEPSLRSCHCWVGDRFNSVNICIGILLCRPQYQWSIGLGQPHLTRQGPGGCATRVCRRRRDGWREPLPDYLLSVKLPFLLDVSASRPGATYEPTMLAMLGLAMSADADEGGENRFNSSGICCSAVLRT